MTVLLRWGTPAPDDHITPMAATLAMLCEAINERPLSIRGEPLMVDDGTYAAAETEMLAIRKARGYSDLGRAQLPNRNFLLFGVPIVAETDSNG